MDGLSRAARTDHGRAATPDLDRLLRGHGDGDVAGGSSAAAAADHAFLADLVKATGAALRQVQITRLADDTFYAAVILAGSNGVQSVDARPSDALNLALATGTPMYVEPSVLVAAEQEAQRRFGRTSAEPPNFPEQGWDGPAAIVANHQQWMAAAQEARRRRLGGGTAP